MEDLDYSDLSDRHYYLVAGNKKDLKFANQYGSDIVSEIITKRNLPIRTTETLLGEVMTGRLLLVWEFGVLGEIKIEEDKTYHS